MENDPSEFAIKRPMTETEDAAVRSFRNAAIWALKDGRGHEEAFDEILQWGAVLLLRFNEWLEAEGPYAGGDPAPSRRTSAH